MKPANLLFLCFLALFYSCSELEKAENFLEPLSEKEAYKKENNISDELYAIWESRVELALMDSLKIELPYQETGELHPRNFAIYSYDFYLMPGEVLSAKMLTDTSSTMIFPSLYKVSSKGKRDFQEIKHGKAEEKEFRFEIREKGLYKLVFQPEIEANSLFTLQIEKRPAYLFPVANGRNADIGSYWGDIRDGGNRLHKGIDIFANRGTPVIAAIPGRVSYSGEKGLGGKQVWLRDPKRKQSLYYAHLDSIVPGLRKVSAGDTIGFVGNTGNARTTPPHLHFGIYRKGEGAIDPLGFVYHPEEPEATPTNKEIANRIMVNTKKAQMRNKPATSNSRVLRTGLTGEVLSVQGKSSDWFHVRDSLDRSMYIHSSQVKLLF